MDKLKLSIDNTLDSDKNKNLNTLISKINSAFSDVIPGDRAKEFQIIVDEDEKSKVKIRRDCFVNNTNMTLVFSE